jgi:hypothetical protein
VLGELGTDESRSSPLPSVGKTRRLVRAGTRFLATFNRNAAVCPRFGQGLPAGLSIRRAGAAARDAPWRGSREAHMPPAPHLPQVTGLAPFNIVSKGVASASVMATTTTA